MFAKSKVSGREILFSIILGAAAAIISLFILWNSIQSVGDNKSLVPVSQNVEPVTFYATQHGAFKTQESAQSFQKQHVSLNKSMLYFDGQTYYIWSKLHVTKTTEVTTPASFSKAITLQSNSCTVKEIANIPQLLQEEKALNNSFEGKTVPTDWQQQVETISAVTTDVSEIRLMLLQHYLQKESCLVVQFN